MFDVKVNTVINRTHGIKQEYEYAPSPGFGVAGEQD
jgi:hypothetical protein